MKPTDDNFDVDTLVEDLIRRMKTSSSQPATEESKQRALAALAELQRILEESGVTEEELQEEGRRIREQLVRERYPRLFKAEDAR